MRYIIKRHLEYWHNKKFVSSVILGLLFLSASLLINSFTTQYAIREGGDFYVQDIILSNTPVFDTKFFVLYWAVFLIFFVISLNLIQPKIMPFVTKSAALFIFIRSIFLTLTHIGPYPERLLFHSSEFFRIFGFGLGGEYFFSGHTGFPFLMALIFWQHKYLRPFFLVSSVLMAASVLLAHVHYSIDVLAAFFITPTIFYLAKKFFAKDYEAMQ